MDVHGAKTLGVFLPSLLLVTQTLLEWKKTCRLRVHYLLVCSDAAAGRRPPSSTSAEASSDSAPEDDRHESAGQPHSGDDADDVAEAAETSPDLAMGEAFGAPTTNPEDIVRFLETVFVEPSVVFCTYDSAALVGIAQRRLEAGSSRATLDFAICDEAHKTATKSASKMSAVLDNDTVSIKQRLFFTATPRHATNGHGFSMDDPNVYGETWYSLSYKQAAHYHEVIKPFRIAIVVIDSAEMKRVPHRSAVTGVDVPGPRPPTARETAISAGILEAMDDYRLSKALTFHNRNSRALRMKTYLVKFCERQRIEASVEVLNGDMNAEERRRRLKVLRNRGDVIVTSARVLQEGVDIPNVDLVVLVCPRYSEQDIAQAVGRAVRNYYHKEFGCVLLPIFVHAADANDQVCDAREFQKALRVLRALLVLDETLASKATQSRELLGEARARAGNLHMPYWKDLPLFAHFDVRTLRGQSVDIDALWPQLSVRLLEGTTEVFDEMVGRFREYKKENQGSGRVPLDYALDQDLASWAERQRQKYSANKLTPGKMSGDHIARLNTEGFVWNNVDDRWDTQFEEFRTAVLATGCFSSDSDMSRRASEYRRATLKPYQRELLNDLQFPWDVRALNWDTNFGAVRAFLLEHGSLRGLPTKHRNWIKEQRAADQQGKLTDERRSKISSLPHSVL